MIYGKLKKDIGQILRELCEYKEVEIVEANACVDHIHMLVRIPPKMSVSYFMGYLKREEHADDIRAACESKVQVWSQAILV